MSRVRVWALGLAVQVFVGFGSGGAMAADQAPDCRKAKGGRTLAFRIDADRRPYRIGESIPIMVILTNCAKKAQAVEPRQLFRYINFEKLAKREGEFGVAGQVLGDGLPPDGGGATMSVLAPGKSFSEGRDVAPLLANVITEPGSYKVWLEYCYWGPKVVKDVAAPRGCIESNEIVLYIVPR